jgi:hypothetical protein
MLRASACAAPTAKFTSRPRSEANFRPLSGTAAGEWHEANTVASGLTTFGKYQRVEWPGRGGMAEVWQARILESAAFQRTLVVNQWACSA